MRNLKEININDGTGQPVSNPSPTQSQIESIEELIGVPLPEDYIEFLNFSNGGCPELDTFEVVIRSESQNWSIGRFYKITDDQNAFDSLNVNYHNYSSVLGEKILPIAEDGGGNQICLDFTSTEFTPVVLWIHDSSNKSLVKVADSFAELIDSLKLNPDYL